MPPKHRTSTTPPSQTRLPLYYRLFFLYIEPLSTIIGAYYAHFQPSLYLHLTHSPSHPSPLLSPSDTTAVTAVLSQLANLYLLFALNEGLVLRCTTDARVWRTLLFGLLVADLGHLWSVRGTGSAAEVYMRFWGWNRMDWGNVGFVYVGALTRICFLLGVGLG